MQVQNPEATAIIRDQAGLTIAEGFPQNLSSSIVPVMDMTPNFHRLINRVLSATSGSSSVSLGTTDANKVSYLQGFSLSMHKDAAMDVATGSCSLTVSMNGISTVIARIPYITLTAERESIFIALPKPIKLDKNTSITAARGSSTAGVFRIDAVAYLTETQ